jgi:enoyl-CoA hydratase|nr:crotonase/enoyl-CoA hydratase family protein [Kofleriaceae bacterium]
MAELVRYELTDGVAVVTMDDGKANALSVPMIDAVLAALARAAGEATAMVLAGRPDRFSGGFDLKVMMSGPAAAVALLTRGADLLMKLYGAPLPLIVACTGHAMAGGALTVLTGDYRVCARGDYKIGLNEAAIGMPVPVLAMELARDRLSKRALTRATLLGEIYDPEGALSVGYVDELAAPGDVVARATAEAKRLGAISKMAFKATKKRLRGDTIAKIVGSSEADLKDLLPGT